MYKQREHDDFWYRSELGSALMEEECSQLERILPTLFGLHSVQLGRHFPAEAFAASVIKYHQVLSFTHEPHTESTLCSCAEVLPFASESLDLMLLPHVLEYSRHPHAVLREVDRCLVGDGHLLLFAFNPWSYWMPWRWLRRRSHHYPWRGHFYSRGRLHDWLSLLGFEICESRHYFFRPPFNNQTLLQKSAWVESPGLRYLPLLAAGYLILARKRMEVMTPLPSRRRPSRLIKVGLSPP